LALADESDDDLQDLIHKVDAESWRFGLKICASMTEVQCIATHEQTLAIDINGEQTKDFLYLGEQICDSSADVDRRIGLASRGARRLTLVWKSRDPNTKTKVRLYN